MHYYSTCKCIKKHGQNYSLIFAKRCTLISCLKSNGQFTQLPLYLIAFYNMLNIRCKNLQVILTSSGFANCIAALTQNSTLINLTSCSGLNPIKLTDFFCSFIMIGLCVYGTRLLFFLILNSQGYYIKVSLSVILLHFEFYRINTSRR